MTNFSTFWDKEVKPLAQDCIPNEPELLRLINENMDYIPTEEDKKYLQEMSKKYKDIFGISYILDMISKVEHALADGRESMAHIALTQVNYVLTSPSYFQNVFKGIEDDMEWITRKKLSNAISKLLLL